MTSSGMMRVQKLWTDSVSARGLSQEGGLTQAGARIRYGNSPVNSVFSGLIPSFWCSVGKSDMDLDEY